MKRVFFLVTLMMLLLLPIVGWATTYTVSSEAEWDTAYSNATDGDKIQIVSSWTSTKQYEITKQITIEGVNDPVIIVGADVLAQFFLHADNVTIKDLTVDGNKENFSSPENNMTGISVSGDNCKIIDCTVVNTYGAAIYIQSYSENTLIQDCTLLSPGLASSSHADGVYMIRANNTMIKNVRVEGDSNFYTDDGFYLYASDHVTIMNCIINNVGRAGVNMYSYEDAAKNSEYTYIVGCKISNFGGSEDADGISAKGYYTVARGNVIEQNISTGNVTWGIECSGYCTGSIIESNYIGGQYLTRGFSGGGNCITFKRNVVNVQDSVLYQNPHDSVFSYSLFHGTVTLEAQSSGNKQVKVYNNTFVNTTSADIGLHVQETNGVFDSCPIKNNIIVGYSKGVVIDDKDDDGISVIHGYNCYHNNTSNLQKNVSGTYSDLSLNSNEFVADPLLTPNYRLSANSPCINAGTTISGFHETALDRDKEPITGIPDVGSDERKALWWDGRRWHGAGLMVGYTAPSTTFNIQDEGLNNIQDEGGNDILDES